MVSCAYRDAGYKHIIPSEYKQIPHPDLLISELERHCIKTDSPESGDIILFRIRRNPQHLAIYIGNTFIHAYYSAGAVVETEFNRFWKHRILGFYTLKND